MLRELSVIDGEAIALLRQLMEVGADREQRTVLQRGLARLMVEMRQNFPTDSGEPDWAGRTMAYRMHVRDLYGRASYPMVEAPNVQAAVRYHVGNMVRELLEPQQVADAGLVPESPMERGRAFRARQTALLRAARRGVTA